MYVPLPVHDRFIACNIPHQGFYLCQASFVCQGMWPYSWTHSQEVGIVLNYFCCELLLLLLLTVKVPLQFLLYFGFSIFSPVCVVWKRSRSSFKERFVSTPISNSNYFTTEIHQDMLSISVIYALMFYEMFYCCRCDEETY